MMDVGLNKFMLGLIVIGYFALILIPAYLCITLFYFFYLNVSMPLFLFLLPLVVISLYILYIIFFGIETKIILAIFDNPKKEGTFKLDKVHPASLLFSLNDMFSWMMKTLLNVFPVSQGIIGDIIYRAYGNKIGKNVMFAQPINDNYLIEFGNNIILGKNSMILGHFIVQDKIYLKRTKIGNNVTIGSQSIIGPGVIIEDNVIVGAKSFVKQNSVLKKNSLYVGCPAKFKKKLK